MTPEGKVKQDIKRLLSRSPGIYQFWPVQTGYGASTIDCLACVQGQFIAFEVKRPGALPTPRQRVVMEQIEAAGGYAFCADNIDAFIWQIRKKVGAL